MSTKRARVKPRDVDYQRLLEMRTGLRRFLHWSEELAHSVGLTPMQHQLLLAVRGHFDPRGPAISDVAQSLLVRHNSAVELVDRAEGAGLVRRAADEDDARVVRLMLTAEGSERLEALAAATMEEVARLAPRMEPLWAGLEE
ncbi:MAG: MarR family winged helix-turn-helix transcriptional regulator [Acidimicrobiales bacterium]